MREGRKRRLQASGWKVGTVSEFLGLSKEETAFIELKMKLGRSLRRNRERRALTQEEVARMVKSSQSRVAKMEAGDPAVSIDLLIRTLLALGVSDRAIARAIAPARRSLAS